MTLDYRKNAAGGISFYLPPGENQDKFDPDLYIGHIFLKDIDLIDSSGLLYEIRYYLEKYLKY